MRQQSSLELAELNLNTEFGVPAAAHNSPCFKIFINDCIEAQHNQSENTTNHESGLLSNISSIRLLNRLAHKLANLSLIYSVYTARNDHHRLLIPHPPEQYRFGYLLY